MSMTETAVSNRIGQFDRAMDVWTKHRGKPDRKLLIPGDREGVGAAAMLAFLYLTIGASSVEQWGREEILALFKDIAEEGLGVVEGGGEGVAGRFLEYAKERLGAMRDKQARQARQAQAQQARQAQIQQAQIQKLFDAFASQAQADPLPAHPSLGVMATRSPIGLVHGGRTKGEPTAEDWADFEAWVDLQEPGN